MEGADALGLIAEVGIAIAGFAGVIAALRAPGGRMAGYAAVRTGTILVGSANLVLHAQLPLALHFAGLTSPTIWALSSCSMTAMMTSVFVVVPALMRRVLPTGEDPAPGSWLVGPTLGILMGATLLLQLSNVVFIRQLWPFYVGLLMFTASALFQFGYALFAPARAEVPA